MRQRDNLIIAFMCILVNIGADAFGGARLHTALTWPPYSGRDGFAELAGAADGLFTGRTFTGCPVGTGLPVLTAARRHTLRPLDAIGGIAEADGAVDADTAIDTAIDTAKVVNILHTALLAAIAATLAATAALAHDWLRNKKKADGKAEAPKAVPSDENVSASEAAPAFDRTPAIEDSVPLFEDVPIDEDAPVSEHQPAVENTPALEDYVPLFENVPPDEAAPVSKAQLAFDEDPPALAEDVYMAENALPDEAAQASEDALAFEGTPALEDDVPMFEDAPPDEAAPVSEDAPVSEAATPCEDTPVSVETSAVEDTPQDILTVKDILALDDTSLTDNEMSPFDGTSVFEDALAFIDADVSPFNDAYAPSPANKSFPAVLQEELDKAEQTGGDVVLLSMEWARPDLTYQQLMNYAAFEWKEGCRFFEKPDCNGVYIIVPDSSLDELLTAAKSFHRKVRAELGTQDARLLIGITARSGRTLDSGILIGEAERALVKARELGLPIMAFKADPNRYKEFKLGHATENMRG